MSVSILSENIIILLSNGVSSAGLIPQVMHNIEGIQNSTCPLINSNFENSIVLLS